MAAAINHWINNVEQMESTIGRLVEDRDDMRTVHLVSATGQSTVDSMNFEVIFLNL